MPRNTHAPQIRYAVIGAGQSAQQAFMPGMARASNSTLAALVTGDPRKASRLAEQYGIAAYHYDDLPELIRSGDIDAAYLATPNALHRRYAVPVLEAGLHLMVEKPMATSVADCEAMLEAQRRGGGRLMVAYRLHCEPGTVELSSRCRNGDFGHLMAFSSTFGQNFAEANHRGHGGYWSGPVPDMGTYPLNAVRNLFAREPLEVHAVGSRTPGRGFNFDDTVTVTLRFAEGRMAHFLVSYACAPVENFSLVGDRGSVTAAPCYLFGPDIGITYTTLVDGHKEVRRHAPVEQFGGEIAYFSHCILNGHDPEPDGEEGLRDVRVLAAIERALLTGQPQALAPLPPARVALPDQVMTLAPVREPRIDERIAPVPQSA